MKIKTYPNMCVSGDNIDASLIKDVRFYTSADLISDALWKSQYKGLISIDKDSGNCYSSVSINKPMIVNKPNGSQNYPDMMFLYNHRGIPIEFKSSKSGEKILWNGGLPTRNGIYIFNGEPSIASPRNKISTTFFLGSSILNDKERSILIDGGDYNKRVADNLFNPRLIGLGSKWSLYARAMFNSGERILSCSERTKREDNVINFLQAFNWNKQQR
jgi:hypothetical protein